MKLEQIDTSTTAGKAEVMRLAAEGRRVAFREFDISSELNEVGEPDWNWRTFDYAIIVEPTGPKELMVYILKDRAVGIYSETIVGIVPADAELVRYVRAEE